MSGIKILTTKPEYLRGYAYSIWWNLLLLTVGSVINAAALKAIAEPQQFIPGGLFGLASLLYYTSNWLTPAVLFFLLNLPIFVLGWVKLSPRFVLYSLYSMALVTLTYEFTPWTLHIQNQLYAAVACGVISGLGGGIILRSLGSGGGIDVIAVYLFQRYNIGVGKVYTIFNAALFLCSIATISLDFVIASLIMVFISSVTVEHTLALFSQRKVVLIVSDYSEEIAKAIMDSMKQTATFLNGIGAYSKKEKKVILTVVNNIQLKRLEEITFSHDEYALFIVENTFTVLGASFSKRKIY